MGASPEKLPLPGKDFTPRRRERMSVTTMTPKRAVLQAVAERRRIPDLEPLVLQNPIAACYYAKNVVKGRWQEGESAISAGLRSRFVDFNIIDEDDRPVVASGWRSGPRPSGSGHVKAGNNFRVMVVYMGLAKCRVPAFEPVLAEQRWKGDAYDYCKFVYRYTGELIDLDCPEVCAWMIKDLCFNKVSKKIGRAERIRVCKELHKRMILHSFGKGDNREVRDYFAAYKKSENHFLVFMSQMDENMTVGEVMRKMTEGV